MDALASNALSPRVKEFLSEQPLKMFIGGEWLPAACRHEFLVYDPSSGATIAQVAKGEAEDVDAAVQAARQALPAWRAISPAERTNLLWKLTELIERDADFLAQLDTLNVGLPLDKTRHGEIPAMIDDFRYYAGWTTKIQGKTIPVSTPGYMVYTTREPMGVCGAIIPWNYPLEGVSGKLGPALACGNTVVMKPAEETPLSALWIGKLVAEAGFPPGVVNIVPGFGEGAGAALANHPGVDKIAFTGSTEVGRKIVHASAGNLKRISLELGGKSPNVILADADLNQAIDQAVWAIYAHAGQNCIAGSRLYLERKIYDQVLAGLAKQIREIRVGPAFDSETQVGPLISQRQLERVGGYIQEGQAAGATVKLGGARPSGVPEGGYFLEPTLFTEVHETMAVVQEEIFGPVLCVLSFDDFDELIQRANDTTYGLAASIWTRDLNKASRFAQEIQAGIVWINGHGLYDSAAPFGGYRQSGFGRELGEDSISEYTQVKTVWLGYAG
jgi:phenylacetaldehyde dehydrogenase